MLGRHRSRQPLSGLVETHPDKRILAIDADPAVGLSTALGIEVQTTVDDIRKAVVETVEDGDTKSAMELLGEARYRIFDALVETDGFSFIAIGRPESAGCYCKINSYLKEVISILSENFDYVVIDGEAGIEQINRRVMEKVTDLLLITDSSKKGTQVIATIKKVDGRTGHVRPGGHHRKPAAVHGGDAVHGHGRYSGAGVHSVGRLAGGV